jgi:hypothetical protein
MPTKKNPTPTERWLGGLKTMQEEEVVKSKTAVTENTSGLGRVSTIPSEIRGWNWGAFFFGWMWGISNKVWITLLSAIPFVGVIMFFVLGVKGNEWAWRAKRWDSIEHFKETQRTWALWAWVVIVVYTVLVIWILLASAS